MMRGGSSLELSGLLIHHCANTQAAAMAASTTTTTPTALRDPEKGKLQPSTDTAISGKRHSPWLRPNFART